MNAYQFISIATTHAIQVPFYTDQPFNIALTFKFHATVSFLINSVQNLYILLLTITFNVHNYRQRLSWWATNVRPNMLHAGRGMKTAPTLNLCLAPRGAWIRDALAQFSLHLPPVAMTFTPTPPLSPSTSFQRGRRRFPGVVHNDSPIVVKFQVFSTLELKC